MRRTITALALMAGAISFSATGAFAANGNAHFIKSATYAQRSGNNLTVTFKEAGLAAGSVETVVASATGTATYECINGGGNHPQAANKETVSTTVTKSGTFTADKNGNIVGSLTIAPPGPGNFTCPPGQTLTGPLNVSYTNVSVTDVTSGATMAISGKY